MTVAEGGPPVLCFSGERSVYEIIEAAVEVPEIPA